MNVYKIILAISSFALISLNSYAAPDWDRLECLDDRAGYIDEAVKVMVSGYITNPKSPCMNQDNFKYFDITTRDDTEVQTGKVNVLRDDFTYKIKNKKVDGMGYLSFDVEFVSGKTKYFDSMTIFGNSRPGRGPGSRSCFGFSSTPDSLFVKASCQK